MYARNNKDSAKAELSDSKDRPSTTLKRSGNYSLHSGFVVHCHYMIIGISGPTASGKTTVAKMLELKKNAFRVRYSEMLAVIATERGLPHDKATLQELYLSEREKNGEDFLAKAMERRILTLPFTLLVVEGNRRLADIDMLKRVALQKNEELVLLFIDAPKDVRFGRFNERLIQNEEPPISRETFEELEANGAEDQIDDIQKIFLKEGLVIDASTHTPEDIYDVVEEFLRKK